MRCGFLLLFLFTLGGLLGIAGGMTMQNLLLRRMEWYFWVPWALGVLYLYVRRVGSVNAPVNDRGVDTPRSPRSENAC